MLLTLQVIRLLLSWLKALLPLEQRTNMTTSIATDATTGVVTLSLTATETAALDAERYVYDLEITSGAAVTRVIEGIITVRPQVTV